MKPTDFFAAHPVFTYDEFVAAHASKGERSRLTSATSLRQHVAAGNLLRIRRGLYATVPHGVDPDHAAVDPYLVTTKLTDDAAVAYHAALQFHGKAYSVWQRFHYLTRLRARPLYFRGLEFVPVQAPVAVRNRPELGGGIAETRHTGGVVRVATLERTLVDVLDAPDKCGGWEEIWRSLEMVEFFDLDAVIEYALKLGSALTMARLGFFLEQHRQPLMVEDRHLDTLRAHAPAQPRYFDSSRESGRLVADWNLVVPERVLERGWEEVA
ncbi:MAG: type IV toxin-antitoxin system AbiEi family antitoxin [Gemmatimonadales bacterium]|jgi:predicted transcriptional regulator of viral defense system